MALSASDHLAIRLSKADRIECAREYVLAMRRHDCLRAEARALRMCRCALVRDRRHPYGVQTIDRWAFRCDCLIHICRMRAVASESYRIGLRWRKRWHYLSKHDSPHIGR